MSKKVLTITGDGGEEMEVYYPYERVREDGFTPVVASTAAKELALKLHQALEGEDTYSEFRGRTIRATLAFGEVNPEDYAALIIPGGRAPEYLRLREDVLSVVRAFVDAGKPVGAVCHGPMVLAEAGVLKGVKATAVGDIKPEVVGSGAVWTDDRVAQDGGIVTAQTWEDCGPWMGAVMALLK